MKPTSKIFLIVVLQVTVLHNREGFPEDFDAIRFFLSSPKATFHSSGKFIACGIICFVCFYFGNIHICVCIFLSSYKSEGSDTFSVSICSFNLGSDKRRPLIIELVCAVQWYSLSKSFGNLEIDSPYSSNFDKKGKTTS